MHTDFSLSLVNRSIKEGVRVSPTQREWMPFIELLVASHSGGRTGSRGGTAALRLKALEPLRQMPTDNWTSCRQQSAAPLSPRAHYYHSEVPSTATWLNILCDQRLTAHYRAWTCCLDGYMTVLSMRERGEQRLHTGSTAHQYTLIIRSNQWSGAALLHSRLGRVRGLFIHFRQQTIRSLSVHVYLWQGGYVLVCLLVTTTKTGQYSL